MTALVVAFSVAACGRGEEPAEGVSGEAIGVTVQQARLGSIRDVVTAAGTVVPSVVGDQTVSASESSEIVELPKAEGEKVEAGDVLVRLEVPSVVNEIATRQLELAEATQRFERAKADAERLTRLFEQGLAARNQAEAARAAMSSAEANLNQVRTRLDAAKAMDAGSVIRARFAGVVVKRWHLPGDLVIGSETDPIIRIVDPTRLQVALQVPLAQADRVSLGQLATVQSGAGAEPAVVAQKTAPSGLDVTSVEVRLNFVTTSTLAIETAVQAEIVLEDRQNVLVVPAAAVQRGEASAFVWVATDSAQASKREVRVGLTANDLTQITSGLMPGDQVITTSISMLTEGAAIQISR